MGISTAVRCPRLTGNPLRGWLGSTRSTSPRTCSTSAGNDINRTNHQSQIARASLSQVDGKSAEGLAGQHAVDVAADVQHQRGERHQQNDTPNAERLHAGLPSFPAAISIIRCTTYKHERETRNMSQPENSWKNPMALTGSQYWTH